MSKMTWLVFTPHPAVGHVYSTVETAKQLVDRDSRIFVTVLLMTSRPDSSDENAYLDKLVLGTTAGRPRLQFIRVPKDDSFFELIRGASPESSFNLFMDYHRPRVRDVVAKLIESDDSLLLSGFVLDMTFVYMADVADEFGVPSYFYFTSGANYVGLMLYLQKLCDDDRFDPAEYKAPDAEFAIPGYSNPVPSRVMPSFVTDEDVASRSFKDNLWRFKKAKGVLVNTFRELETYAFDSFSALGERPKVYPVGPVVNIGGATPAEAGDVMAWLDGQPTKSVVFLCFGSRGRFSPEQAREVARALERAGSRFLWALGPAADTGNVGEMFPEGFLDRTAESGKIIGWAPQAAVLAHEAVGGFVSHCGWNSTLESIWHGVSVAAWPMYAEQHANAFVLVKELRLAVELTWDYQMDRPEVVIGEEEIVKGIEGLMDEEGNNAMMRKKRLEEMKEASRKAMLKGGSSYAALGCFIDDVCDH